MLKWVLLLVAMSAPAVARAQTAPPNAAVGQVSTAQLFAAVMQDPGHRREVLNAAQATPGWARRACKAATYAQAPEVGVYAPVRFDERLAPVAGEWREGIIVTGCGAKIQLNVLTKITAPSTLATGPLLPGGTIADPVLQNAAQFSAIRALGGLPAGCTQAFVANTVFGGYTGSPDHGLPKGEIAAPWAETWSFNLCGVVKMVKLDFMPSAQGVSIEAVPVS